MSQTSTLLSKSPHTFYGLIGLDGYVDQIIRVVDSVENGKKIHIRNIGQFGQRILGASGKSTAMELDIQADKLGGNGPIMANSLAQLGLPLSCLGAFTADGSIHPVFQEMAGRCELISLCDAARTDAYEFEDGKIMFQRQAGLPTLDYQQIVDSVGVEPLRALFERADLVALNHWASLPHMDEIWLNVQAEICPTLSEKRRVLFADLADPEKRSHADIQRACDRLPGFMPFYEVILGLNLKEGLHLCEVLGLEPEGEGDAQLQQRAALLREHLGITAVAIHPVDRAVIATADGTCITHGPYTEKPLISTGAGDHFNAGLAYGWLLGAEPAGALRIAAGNAGRYVTTAKSATATQLGEFLSSL